MLTLGLILIALIVRLIAAHVCNDDPRLRIILLWFVTLAAVTFLVATVEEVLKAASGTGILATGAQQAYADDVCGRRGSEATDVFVDHMPRLDDTHIVGPRLVTRCAAKDGVTSGHVYWLSSDAGVPHR